MPAKTNKQINILHLNLTGPKISKHNIKLSTIQFKITQHTDEQEKIAPTLKGRDNKRPPRVTQMLESPDNDCKVASVTMFYETKMISHETSEKIEIVSQKMKYYFLNRD